MRWISVRKVGVYGTPYRDFGEQTKFVVFVRRFIYYPSFLFKLSYGLEGYLTWTFQLARMRSFLNLEFVPSFGSGLYPLPSIFWVVYLNTCDGRCHWTRPSLLYFSIIAGAPRSFDLLIGYRLVDFYHSFKGSFYFILHQSHLANLSKIVMD